MAKPVYVALHALIASIVVAVPLTFVMTAVNVGFIGTFWETYLSSLLLAIAVAAPASLVAVPFASLLLRRFANAPAPRTRAVPQMALKTD